MDKVSLDTFCVFEDFFSSFQMLSDSIDDILSKNLPIPQFNHWPLEIRSDERTKNIPVIVLTAKNEEADMFKRYDLGANDYLTKPLTEAQLLYGLKLMFEEIPKEIRV